MGISPDILILIACLLDYLPYGMPQCPKTSSSRAGLGHDQGMLTIPEITSSFGASTAARLRTKPLRHRRTAQGRI
jgi:hypothetical protein